MRLYFFFPPTQYLPDEHDAKVSVAANIRIKTFDVFLSFIVSITNNFKIYYNSLGDFIAA